MRCSVILTIWCAVFMYAPATYPNIPDHSKTPLFTSEPNPLPPPITPPSTEEPDYTFVIEIPTQLRDGRFDWMEEGALVTIQVVKSFDKQRAYALVFARTECGSHRAVFGYLSSASPEADAEAVVATTNFSSVPRIILLDSPNESDNGIWIEKGYESLTKKDFEPFFIFEE